MATQQEVVSYIKATFTYKEIEANVFLLPYELENGRSQQIFAYVDDYKIVVSSGFAKVSEITPQQAFDASEDSVWGIKTLGDHYVIRGTAFIADVDPSEILHTFLGVAMTADAAETKLGLSDKY
jgi:hypothetical protein